MSERTHGDASQPRSVVVGRRGRHDGAPLLGL